MRAIPIAVVGCGLMGRRHCEIIRLTEGFELAGVLDRNPEVAAAVAGTARVYHNYEALLADRDIEAVVICLPSAQHSKYGILAARARKHVIVEKPIDADSIAARHLIQECETARVLCAVISQNRFSDGLSALYEGLSNGDLGKPTLARASVKWYRHDEYYLESDWRGTIAGERGGVLMNQAIHSLDIFQWYFGRPVDVSCYTFCSRPDVMETEDVAVATLKFQSGLLATLEASTSAAPGFSERYEIQSSVASCFVEGGHIVHWHHASGKPPPTQPITSIVRKTEHKLDLFLQQYQNILAAIIGDEPLAVTPQEALSVVETVERLYAADHSGRPR